MMEGVTECRIELDVGLGGSTAGGRGQLLCIMFWIKSKSKLFENG